MKLGKVGAGMVCLILLLASGAGIASLKLRLDAIPRTKVPGSSIIYLPSGMYLKYATFGFSSLMADFVYLWAIQYYSSPDITDRFDHLDHIFSVIAELDPKYQDPYLIGAIIAIYEAKDVPLALRLLDKAMEKNPDEWIFPFEAGHYAQIFLKDFELAKKYYKTAMEIKGAPDITKRLYANSAFKTQAFRTAWESWLEVYNTAQDERVKKIASNHLYQVKAAVDIAVISNALSRFRERYGRYPQSLDRLISVGLLPALLKDLDGQDYIYDPETGEVNPAVIPWKR